MSSCEAQKEAIIRIIKWPDDGTESVSKRFREFYGTSQAVHAVLVAKFFSDGLLFYCNVKGLFPSLVCSQLVDILFEIHGSDPRKFPEATKMSLRLLSDVLNRDTVKDWCGSTLWGVLDECSALGSHAAITLRGYLEHYKRDWDKTGWGFNAPWNPCK